MRKLFIMFCTFIAFTGIIAINAAAANPIFISNYWTFDDDETSGNLLYDLVEDNNLTNNGATTGVSGIIEEAYTFDGSNDYLISNHTLNISTGELTVNAWVACDVTNELRSIWSIGSTTDDGLNLRFTTNPYLQFFEKINNDYDQTVVSLSCNTTGFHMITVTISDSANSGEVKIYYDGVYKATGTIDATLSSIGGPQIYIGTRWTGSGQEWWDGEIDEISVFTEVLDQTNITYLYNSGNPDSNQQYPFTVDTASNFTVTVTDYWNSNPINGINVSIGGTTYQNTTGNVVTTGILSNATTTYDINISGSQHFSANITGINVSSNLAQTLKGSDITFNAYELITNNLLSGATFTVNTTNGTNNTHFYIAPGSNLTVLTENAGYFNKTQGFNVSALDNRTINVTGVYSSVLNITAINKYTTNPINNFSGWVYHPGSGNNRSFNTTTGSYNISMIPGNFTIYVEADNYSISSDNYQNKTISNPGENITFSLYSSNSIIIYIKNENTGLTITDNITIIVTGLNESTYTTTSGTYFLENLTDGNYSLKFSGDNYYLRTYTVTVAERSTQTLTAYLTATSGTVTMTYLDEDSGASLEDVSASMSRLIGGVWTVVQSKDSDITGRVQFTYTPSVKYKFTVSLFGYDTKVFYLDPVIFDSYNVKMSKETTITDAPVYQGVSITISPTTFTNNQINNFSIILNSADGLLTSYSYNVSFPTSKYSSGSGANAYGEGFDLSINITGSSWTDRVKINITYDTSIGTSKNLVYYYEILNPTLDPGVFTDNINNTYGLGLFERILVTMITVIVVVGILSLIGGFILGLPIGMILLGYLMFIGFMPLWAGLPSLFVAVVLIIARTT